MGGGNRGSGKGGNTKWADDAWRRDLEVCETCGAGFREQCRNRRGRRCKPHAGRKPRPKETRPTFTGGPFAPFGHPGRR